MSRPACLPASVTNKHNVVELQIIVVNTEDFVTFVKSLVLLMLKLCSQIASADGNHKTFKRGTDESCTLEMYSSIIK